MTYLHLYFVENQAFKDRHFIVPSRTISKRFELDTVHKLQFSINGCVHKF